MEEPRALSDPLAMGINLPDVVEASTRQSEKVLLHPDDPLPHHAEVILLQKVIYLKDRSCGGVFHRQDPAGDFPTLYRLAELLKGIGSPDGDLLPKQFPDCLLYTSKCV